jgi:hypothetical protein
VGSDLVSDLNASPLYVRHFFAAWCASVAIPYALDLFGLNGGTWHEIRRIDLMVDIPLGIFAVVLFLIWRWRWRRLTG